MTPEEYDNAYERLVAAIIRLFRKWMNDDISRERYERANNRLEGRLDRLAEQSPRRVQASVRKLNPNLVAQFDSDQSLNKAVDRMAEELRGHSR